MKMRITDVLGAAAAIIAAALVVSCETPTRSPTPPAHYGLEIGLTSNETRDAPIGQNIYLKGNLYGPSGEKQRGATVRFELEPTGYASITPFAVTEPDSAHGFRSIVTFRGDSVGVVLIYAYVKDGTGQEVANDTLYMNVIEWNG